MHPVTQYANTQALSRLSPRESYDRAFRHRVAFQQSILHKDLPKAQWTKPEDVSVAHLASNWSEISRLAGSRFRLAPVRRPALTHRTSDTSPRTSTRFSPRTRSEQSGTRSPSSAGSKRGWEVMMGEIGGAAMWVASWQIVVRGERVQLFSPRV